VIGRGGRRAIGVLAAWSLVHASLAAPPPARACSGADPVEAGDLLRHPGAIVVVEVIGRLGRAEEPRSVVLGVRETLRGVTSSIIRLDRPRQASGVCHDVFTGRVGARMLLALAVRTSTGLVLDPAWLVANDDRLLPIYDPVVPWATLSEARQALATPPTTNAARSPVHVRGHPLDPPAPAQRSARPVRRRPRGAEARARHRLIRR
jgi:hypothetical protein